MVGMFQNKQIVKVESSEMNKIIKEWQNRIFATENSWEANDLHIDEINKRFSKRNTWLEGGLLGFKMLLRTQLYETSLLISFLHYSLKDNKNANPILNLSEQLISEELDEFTPPSLMYCDKYYLKENLSNQLIECSIDRSSALSKLYNYHFYFRKWYDEKDNLYSRELYVFNKSLSPQLSLE